MKFSDMIDMAKGKRIAFRGGMLGLYYDSETGIPEPTPPPKKKD